MHRDDRPPALAARNPKLPIQLPHEQAQQLALRRETDARWNAFADECAEMVRPAGLIDRLKRRLARNPLEGT